MIYFIANSLKEVIQFATDAKSNFPSYSVVVETVSDKSFETRLSRISQEKPDQYQGITILFRLDNDNRQLYLHDMGEIWV